MLLIRRIDMQTWSQSDDEAIDKAYDGNEGDMMENSIRDGFAHDYV